MGSDGQTSQWLESECGGRAVRDNLSCKLENKQHDARRVWVRLEGLIGIAGVPCCW